MNLTKKPLSTITSSCKLLLILLSFSIFISCEHTQSKSGSADSGNKKIGVLLVNHGSRSETWRNALLKLEDTVKDSILKGGDVTMVKTAFMEYTEPSIATRLKEFDKEGYTDIIIVPVFLSVSSHSFDDIPTIIGQKEDPQSMETLKIEKIERYVPKAKTHVTPLLDFTDILQKNILKRTVALMKNPEKEGLVMIAYGDQTYTKDWSALLNKVGDYVGKNTGMTIHSHGWCGHIAHYNPDSTTEAIKRVLDKKEKAIVIPVLVAHDEMFQVKIIGDGINKIDNNKEKVVYKPDAILPDENVSDWVIQISREYTAKLKSGTN